MRGRGAVATMVALVIAAVTPVWADQASPPVTPAKPEAHATPSPSDEAAAQKAMVRGVAALDRGDPAAALTDFEAAQKLVPRAPVPHRYAGQALEALKRWDEAIASYETYLRIRPSSKDAADITRRIATLRSTHVEGIVDVLCVPSGASVRLDGSGRSLGVTPLHGVRLTRGAHALTLGRDGYLDKQVSVTVVPGTTVRVQCELAKKLVPPPPPVVEQPAIIVSETPVRMPHTQKPWYKRTWVWAAAGTALVVAGGSYYLTRPDLPSTVGGDVRFP